MNISLMNILSAAEFVQDAEVHDELVQHIRRTVNSDVDGSGWTFRAAD